MNLTGKWPFLFAADRPTTPEPKVNETGWSESTLYAGAFGKYNPDDLMGRKGFGIYRQMLLDEQVKAVVRFKRDAITSREWYFETPEDMDDKVAQERVDLCKAIIREMKGNFMDALNGIMSGMYNGFSMTEIVVKQMQHKGKTYWGIDRLKLRPFDTFTFKVDQHGNAEEVLQRMDGREQTIDMERFIHYVQSPEEDEHYGQSELRAAYRAYWSKDVMIKLYNIFMERMASGFIWAQPKEGHSIDPGSPLETALRNVLSNIQSKTAIILPSQVELNIERPTGDGGYETAIALHDKSIAKALLVPNLLGITEQGNTGSYSQSQTQFEAFLMTLDADATRLEDVLNEQLFRKLGEYNFGDNNHPLFKFKPMSDDLKFKLLQMWKEMVSAGAVKSQPSDEDRLRNMMDMPGREEEEEDKSVNPTTALNGLQVSSMKEIVMDYKSRRLDKESAAQLLVASFPIDLDQAHLILGEQNEEPEPVEPDPLDPNEPDPNEDPEDGDPDPDPVAPEDVVVPSSVEDTGSGSPLNKKKVTKAAMTAAEDRVDFEVIDRGSVAIEEEYVKDIQTATNSIIAYILKNVTMDPEEVAQLEVPIALREPLRRSFGRMLKAGWELGSKHAKAETLKTSSFAEGAPDPLGQAASSYFKSKSFVMSGGLSDRILGKAQQAIFNGIKSNLSLDEISSKVEETLATSGFTKEASQIDTMVRTNVFEAINEARFDYFRDPALNDFVEALEYSAIMDDRTTQICQHLDGKTYEKDSDVWTTHRPPNHYNCRSLLIAVTVDDTWEPSSPPNIDPQEGFK